MSSEGDQAGDTTVVLGQAGYEIIDSLHKLSNSNNVREIGGQAVWSVSSCKQGYGVSLLRDDSLETYWQSDGTQPHMVNVQFRQKTDIDCVAIYTDYKSDESYTPSCLSLRVGNHFHDLREIEQVDMTEPSGWVTIKLRDKTHQKSIRAFILQIAVLQAMSLYITYQNHQNGRDTHIRQIKVFAPTNSGKQFDPIVTGFSPHQFTSVKCSMYSTIR